MSEVKVFQVVGEILKPNFKTFFKKEVRALKVADAKEKIYMEFGSNHRAKRHQIRLLKVVEISPQQIENSIIKKLTLGEN